MYIHVHAAISFYIVNSNKKTKPKVMGEQMVSKARPPSCAIDLLYLIES
jgi:hypothetical protein